AALPASASDAPPAVIESIHAATSAKMTLVDVALQGDSPSALRDEGNRFVLTLGNAAPLFHLSAQTPSSGPVSGIGLERSPDGRGTRVVLVLRRPSDGRIVTGPDAHTIRVAIAAPGELPAASQKATPPAHKVGPKQALAYRAEPSSRLSTPTPVAVPALVSAPVPQIAPILPTAPRLYNVNAYQSDVTGILNSLAQDAGVSIVMAGAVGGKVTMRLHQVPLEKAIDLLTKSAGLAFHQDGATYIVGAAKDIEAAYPAPSPVQTQALYQCQHVNASDLVTSLQNTFDKDQLHISLGASSYSPRLDEATNTAATRIDGTALKSGGSDGGKGEAGLASRTLILVGTPDTVTQALALAAKLDQRRAQVKINVRITDVSLDALKDLGLQWTFGNQSITESQPHGLTFGSFTRSPLSIGATISALEQSNRAKLLAAPSLSLLDGEHGYILIGDRLLYPTLVGYTQAQTPIFDKAEERVGIYLQVAAQIGSDGEVTLSIYPQVSLVTSYLQVNGASYPQISTREQQTTVRVKDGENIVVGGLIRDEEIENIQRVPGLSKIPFFGELFTNRHKTRTRSEVVIVITPEIQKD
ncbi:MAG: hypothetical protein M3Y28_12210, partial [Armatimonadota bacterium]|nr:hypothetical protein [Armatimonadota bacterium]